jgi:hypothetical protein
MKKQRAEVKTDVTPVGQTSGLAKLEEKNPHRQMIQRGRQPGVSFVAVVVGGLVAVVPEEE